MSQNGNYDFLVLGQGLAGSLLAWRLLRRGRRVLVMDDG
ncbi:MAG TPA: FAD-dependent oxidoreductase, partial [Thiolapillus brandeum]|nr:FAD-dependent oxidoreductase [Thiolapillus brandeum]